jgi:hypothetical protein
MRERKLVARTRLRFCITTGPPADDDRRLIFPGETSAPGPIYLASDKTPHRGPTG